MQNIFIVFTDTYSDYSIKGIFSTYEKAENFIENNQKFTGEKEEQKIDSSYILDEFDNLTKGKIFIYSFGDSNQQEYQNGLYNKDLSGESSYYEDGDSIGYSYISMDHAKELAGIAKERYEKEKGLKETNKNYRVKHLVSN